ncbi:MAG: hypothetical protein QM764_22310 [Chitinophagaceae bacterium]
MTTTNHNGNGITVAIPLPETKETMLLYKKKGFFIAKDNAPETFYSKAVEEIEEEGRSLIAACSEDAIINASNISAVTERIREKINEIKERRKEYEVYLKERETVKKEIETKIETSCNELYELFSKLGHKKANIVSTQLESIKDEIFKILETYRAVAKDLNATNEEDFDKAENARKRNLAYAQQLETELKERRDKVMVRLKILSRDGVNPGNSRFLISTGWLAAFIAGWFFSVWAEPGSTIRDSQNVKVFFIDNIGQWLAQYNWFYVLAGVALYAIAIGFVSWFCQKILDKADPSRNLKRKEEHEFTFNSKDENLLDFKVRGRNWWTFWLRLAPLLVVILPIIVMITLQINRDIAANKTPHTFQELFNDFFINLMGSFIAVVLSVFMFVYLSRVSEPAYHKNAEEEKSSRGFKIFHLGFILYALMIGAMLYYHFVPGVEGQLKVIVITGFAASTLATAFSLAYGYIFRGLTENLVYYNRNLAYVSSQIETLSRPRRNSYTDSDRFDRYLEELQEKMFELIASRHRVAENLTKGKARPNTVVLMPGQPQSSNGKGFFYSIFHWRRKPKPAVQDSVEGEHFETGCSVSENEEFYFAEESKKIEALTARIKDDRGKIRSIESEMKAYWRNEEVWASLNSQLNNAEKELDEREKDLAVLKLSTALQIETVKTRTDQKKVWLSEGYYTGRWFRNDPDTPDSDKNLIDN